MYVTSTLNCNNLNQLQKKNMQDPLLKEKNHAPL